MELAEPIVHQASRDEGINHVEAKTRGGLHDPLIAWIWALSRGTAETTCYGRTYYW